MFNFICFLEESGHLERFLNADFPKKSMCKIGKPGSGHSDLKEPAFWRQDTSVGMSFCAADG